MTSNAPRGYELADIIHKHSNARVIMGGMHPTWLPEEALQHADQVIVGEGEKVILDVVEGRLNTRIVQGISLTNVDEEQMKEVPIEKLIKETNGLIRAAAYKKRIEVQNKENYEAGLEAVQSMVFETMAKDDPELYHRVSAYLNKKKSEGMEG